MKKIVLFISFLFAVLPGSSRQLVTKLYLKEPLALKEKILISDYQAVVAYEELLKKWGKLSLSPWQGLIASRIFILSDKFNVRSGLSVQSNGNQKTQVFARFALRKSVTLLGHQKVPP